MSLNSQSERSTSMSSLTSNQPPAKSIIIYGISVDRDIDWLFKKINSTYKNVKQVLRNYDSSDNAMNSIRVDFNSEHIVERILKKDKFMIGEREYSFRPFWPLICHRCHEEGHRARECPTSIEFQWRLQEIVVEQQSNFEQLMDAFEDRWNMRLESLVIPKEVDIVSLKPVVRDLTDICQRMNQENSKMQQKYSEVIQRLNNY